MIDRYEVFEEFCKELPLMTRMFLSKDAAKALFNSGYLCRLKEETEYLREEHRKLDAPEAKVDICKCGHHTNDHSYVPDDLTTNLDCDKCDCNNFTNEAKDEVKE